MKKLLLFDVDGTLVESGQKVTPDIISLLKDLQKNNYELGIVGGGKLDKVLYQFNSEINFTHYFTECGCVYHKYINELKLIYKKNLREHNLHKNINQIVKTALNYLSKVDYELTGHFIDLRNGIIYISLIGMVATQEERKIFINLDKNFNYRKTLLNILKDKANELKILNELDLVFGGSVGIAIYPKEYDKIQVLDYLEKDKYSEIHYFGDKYLEDGNDYKLLNHSDTIAHEVNSFLDTKKILLNFI